MKHNRAKKHQSPKRRRRVTPETMMILRQVVFGVVLMGGLGGLVTGVWYGTRVDALTIDHVTVAGGETISHAAVEAIATETLAGTYFRLIPRQFAWLYPETEIMKNIYALERVQSVKLERPDWTTLHIDITEYRPSALWCNEDDSGNCYFTDATGYAFAIAPNLTGGALVRYTTRGRTPERGAQLLPLSDLAVVDWLYTTLKSELGWVVTQIEIDSVGDVFYTLPDKSELKATLTTDPAEAYANLVAILNSDSFTGLAPGDFQYIDLRFGNKVFVNREPWETVDNDLASSTFAWDELTAEVVGSVRAGGSSETSAAAAEALTVPLIEEDDEEVLIEPTPEVPLASPEDRESTDEIDSESTESSATTSATTAE